MIATKQGFIFGAVPLLALLAGGCGTNFDEILYQAFAASGRTALDIFLTDLANDLADRADGDADIGDDGDSDGGGDGGDGNDGGLDGAALFAANCSRCHGSDGASGFAPDITGATVDEVLAAMSLPTHGSISLTDDELTAIAMFLGGDEPADGGGAVGGDAGAGVMIYVSNGCGSCHCPDASGGCAFDSPALLDVDFETLNEFLRGDAPHTGGKYDLTDQEILDLQVFLNSLS